MAFFILFLLAVAIAFTLHWVKGWWPLSISAPTVGLIAYILFDAYVLPYHSGSTSMWPLAVFFGAPVSLVGGLCGAAAADLAKPL